MPEFLKAVPWWGWVLVIASIGVAWVTLKPDAEAPDEDLTPSHDGVDSASEA